MKGKSALALSRDLGLSYKTAFVLLHKLREAMAEEMKGRTIGGEGKVAEIDGGYFGGYVKPANRREHRRDRRLAVNQSGKRRVVVIVRERGGNGIPAVFKSEADATAFITRRVAKGTRETRNRVIAADPSIHDGKLRPARVEYLWRLRPNTAKSAIRVGRSVRASSSPRGVI